MSIGVETFFPTVTILWNRDKKVPELRRCNKESRKNEESKHDIERNIWLLSALRSAYFEFLQWNKTRRDNYFPPSFVKIRIGLLFFNFKTILNKKKFKKFLKKNLNTLFFNFKSKQLYETGMNFRGYQFKQKILLEFNKTFSPCRLAGHQRKLLIR